MSNKKQIESSLKNLIFNNTKPFVAMLSGEWGIGKTYFWNAFKDNFLLDKQVIYISLFGKHSLEEIEVAIVLAMTRFVSPQQIKGIDTLIPIHSLLHLFTSKDFQNIILCFDDFERLSDKVSLKDVLGLISEFKEQKSCKIVMILNEEALANEDKLFALYKEKIVEYNFNYKPHKEEIFEALKEDLEPIDFCKASVIYAFFATIGLKNIRIMKQSLYYLGHFSFIGTKAYHAQVINHFVEIALNIFVFKAKFNLDYSSFQKDNTYHANYLSTNERLEKQVYYFIDTQDISRDEIESILDKNNLHRDKENVRETLAQIIQRIEYDLNASLVEDTQRLYTLLAKHQSLIPHIVDIQSLKQCLSYIQEHNRTIMSNYFMNEYISSYALPNKGENKKESDFFLALLQKKQKKWHEAELKALNSLEIEDYKEYIENSMDFFYESFAFFERYEYSPDFAYALFRIKEALALLREKNPNIKWKIDRVLKEKGLTLADDTIAFDSEGM